MSFLEGLRKRFSRHLRVYNPVDNSNATSSQADLSYNQTFFDAQISSAYRSSPHNAFSLSGIPSRSLQPQNTPASITKQMPESIPGQSAIYQQEAAKINDNPMDHDYSSTTPTSSEIYAPPNPPSSEQQVKLNGYGLGQNPSAKSHTQLAKRQINSPTHLPSAPDLSSAISVFLAQIELYIHQKDWQKALAACARVLELAPNTAEGYKLKGNILQHMGRPADAMGCYAEALVINPHYPEVHANLGVLHGTLDNWEQAVECYEKAIALNPGFVGAYRHLAQAWEKLDRPENRLDTIYQALSLSPETFTADEHYEMGQHLLEKGQKVDAIECLRCAIELDPNHKNAHQMMAQCLEQQGEWEKAVDHYNQALSIESSSPQVDAKRPEASLQGISQTSLAHAPSDTASQSVRPTPSVPTPSVPVTSGLVTSDPTPSRPSVTEQEALQTSVESLVTLAQSYAQHGNWEKAITHYKNILRLDPHNAHIYRELANALDQLGEIHQALESRYRMLRLRPEWGTAQEHFRLGVALLQKGDVQKARECYSQAVQFDPELSSAIEGLAQLTIPSPSTPVDHVQPSVANSNSNSNSVASSNSVVSPIPSTATLPRDANGQAKISEPLLGDTPASDARSGKHREGMVFHKQGEALADEKRWADAIVAYQAAIQHNPDFFWSHHNLGDALREVEDWEGAALSYQKAIALGSDSAWSHYNLGNVLVKLDRWGEAAKAYQAALALNPDLSGIHNKIDQAIKLQAQHNLERILNSKLGKS